MTCAVVPFLNVKKKSGGRFSVCTWTLTKAMQPKGEFLGGRFGGEPQRQQGEQNPQHVR